MLVIVLYTACFSRAKIIENLWLPYFKIWPPYFKIWPPYYERSGAGTAPTIYQPTKLSNQQPFYHTDKSEVAHRSSSKYPIDLIYRRIVRNSGICYSMLRLVNY